jgi:4-aminobutyrate aminotransferase-like enzyme
VTFIEPDGSWPIVWERAKGVHVWDGDGRKYLDLTAAFGVAAAGHANPRVVRAGQRQMGRLLHAMGDVHPHSLKAELARELSRLTFERWGYRERKTLRFRGKVIFCNSGFEAVEAGLKTAMLATGKPGVIAFQSGYHGLGYGALNATHRGHFREPFRKQLADFGHFVPFPEAEAGDRLEQSGRTSRTSRTGLARLTKKTALPQPSLEQLETQIRLLLKTRSIGALLVEPVQVRGGINVPPPEFLPLLRQLCDEHHALLILDEIYTGFGRTGKWFACEHSGVVPDIICLGKALTGGFPLSACVGRAELMDAAWPPSSGEAIHTSTYLGHPVGCAMALAQIQEIEQRRLVPRSAQLGDFLLSALGSLASGSPKLSLSTRGLGLLTGVEMKESNGAPATSIALQVIKTLLRRGFIFLPEGEHANVISFTPPLTISKSQLKRAVKAFGETLEEE